MERHDSLFIGRRSQIDLRWRLIDDHDEFGRFDLGFVRLTSRRNRANREPKFAIDAGAKRKSMITRGRLAGVELPLIAAIARDMEFDLARLGTTRFGLDRVRNIERMVLSEDALVVGGGRRGSDAREGQGEAASTAESMTVGMRQGAVHDPVNQ